MTAVTAGAIRRELVGDHSIGSSATDTDGYHLTAVDLNAEEAIAFDFDPDPPTAVIEVSFQ